MTETTKERIYRGALETMSDSDFMGNKYVKKFVGGVFKQIEDVSSDTDILSVEKLQEQLNTAKKALTEIDRSRYGMQFRRDRNPNVARQALAAIGGDDE